MTTEASDTKRCPFCDETIRYAAVKCRFCGSDLSETSAGAPPGDLDSFKRNFRCPECGSRTVEFRSRGFDTKGAIITDLVVGAVLSPADALAASVGWGTGGMRDPAYKCLNCGKQGLLADAIKTQESSAPIAAREKAHQPGGPSVREAFEQFKQPFLSVGSTSSTTLRLTTEGASHLVVAALRETLGWRIQASDTTGILAKMPRKGLSNPGVLFVLWSSDGHEVRIEVHGFLDGKGPFNRRALVGREQEALTAIREAATNLAPVSAETAEGPTPAPGLPSTEAQEAKLREDAWLAAHPNDVEEDENA